MVKEILASVIKEIVQKAVVPLPVIIMLWVLLSPGYNNLIQFQTKAEAKFEFHEKKFEKLDVIDDKLTVIMIELGIQKEKIKSIENNKHHSGE